jgi:hypothetical protein
MISGDYGNREEIGELVFYNETKLNPLFAYIKAEALIRAIRQSMESESGREEILLSAPDSIGSLPSDQLIYEFYPEADVCLGGDQSFINTEKAEEILAWEPYSR